MQHGGLEAVPAIGAAARVAASATSWWLGLTREQFAAEVAARQQTRVQRLGGLRQEGLLTP